MTFELTGPVRATEHRGVLCPLNVEGRSLLCHFSPFALEVLAADPHGCPIQQFNMHASQLLSVARTKILAGDWSNGLVYVYSEDVREAQRNE